MRNGNNEVQSHLLESIRKNNLLLIGYTGSGKQVATREIVSELVEREHKVVMLDSVGQYDSYVKSLGGVNRIPSELLRGAFQEQLTNIMMSDGAYSHEVRVRLYEQVLRSLIKMSARKDIDYIVMEEYPFLVERGENIELFLQFMEEAKKREVRVILLADQVLAECTKTQRKRFFQYFPMAVVFESRNAHEIYFGKQVPLETGEGIYLDGIHKETYKLAYA